MEKCLFYLILSVTLVSNDLAANTVKWNLKSLYGINQAGFASIITDAKNHFSTLPNDTIIVQIDAGTYTIGGNGQDGISLNNIGTASATGRLIFKGAGINQTVLIFSDITQDMIHGSVAYGLEFRDMHMTRDRYTVTQGNVVSVAAGEIILELHQGFPTPLELWQEWAQGRYLRRYTNSTTDPQVIELDNEQVPYGWRSGAAKKPELVQGSQWRFFLNDKSKVLSNYKIGEYVGVKSKFEGGAYWFSTGNNLVFENIKWTHSSRGLVRGGFSNVLLKGCRIERGAPIMGQTPCLATPSGGPQMNQYSSSGDPVSSGMVLENCFTESTGDDAVAFFNVNGAKLINCTFRNSFGSGIMVTQEAYDICVIGTSIPNSVIELEDKSSVAPNLRTPVTTSSLDIAYSAGFIHKNCSTDLTSIKKSTYSSHAFSILPNPTSSNLNINFETSNDTNVEILNLLGEVLITKENQSTFDVSNFSNGVYLISIEQNGHKYTQKFIKD